MVCRIIDGTRDMLVSRGMEKYQANSTVLKVRQLFFDPFAAPGNNPTTDPEFKKMLPLFPAVTMYFLDRFRYGAPRYDREGAEKFSVRFVAYAREHFASGAPELSTEEFADLAKNIDTQDTGVSFNSSAYDYIQVKNWNEMQALARKYRLDTWCIAKYEEDWEKFTLRGQGKFYLLVKEGAEHSDGDNDVIGIAVNHYGRVTAAYNRPNICVDIDAVTGLADSLGLTKPFAFDFSAANDLMKAGYDYGDIFTYFDDLDSNHAVVGVDNCQSKCIFNTYTKQYVTDPFDDYSPVKGTDELVIIDGCKLFSLREEEILFRLPPTVHLGMPYSGYDEDNKLFWLSGTGNRSNSFVNAVCLTDHDYAPLLDASNNIPIVGATFNTTDMVTKGYATGDTKTFSKPPTIEHMGKDDFWVLDTKDGYYIVDRPRKPLSDCIMIPSREGTGWNEVLTSNGYYVNVNTGIGTGRESYYLMKDGKRVFDCPFKDAGRDRNDSYDIYLVTMSGDIYHFDPFSGNTRKG